MVINQSSLPQEVIGEYNILDIAHDLWTHKTQPVWLILVVDDFGIKYVGYKHAEHLIAPIKKNYEISSNWTGSEYCGLKIDWDYNNGTVDLSMPGYIKAALHKYQHPTPAHAEHAPHTWNSPVYGAKTQYIVETEDIPPLSPKEVNNLQQIGGTLIYYALEH
jgi:hypothetical protein